MLHRCISSTESSSLSWDRASYASYLIVSMDFASDWSTRLSRSRCRSLSSAIRCACNWSCSRTDFPNSLNNSSSRCSRRGFMQNRCSPPMQLACPCPWLVWHLEQDLSFVAGVILFISIDLKSVISGTHCTKKFLLLLKGCLASHLFTGYKRQFSPSTITTSKRSVSFHQSNNPSISSSSLLLSRSTTHSWKEFQTDNDHRFNRKFTDRSQKGFFWFGNISIVRFNEKMFNKHSKTSNHVHRAIPSFHCSSSSMVRSRKKEKNQMKNARRLFSCEKKNISYPH